MRNCSTRAVKDPPLTGPSMTQPGEECQRLPIPVRNPGQQWCAARTPAARAGHAGLDPGLVDKDRPGWINAVLMGSPAHPQPSQLRAFRLTRQQRFSGR